MNRQSIALISLLGTLLIPQTAPAHNIILQPNGGETFTAGDVVTIEWAIGINHNLQNWDIWYTTADSTTNSSCGNSSGPWTAIQLNIPPTCSNGGGGLCSAGPCVTTYLWTIPTSLASNTVKIRVRMDNSATDYYDRSDAPFSVLAPTSLPSPNVAARFVLEQARPNPFNPQTTIGFVLQEDVPLLRLVIHDVRGAGVKTLIDGPYSAGRGSAIWDGTDESGIEVASGVYFYRLQVDAENAIRKIVLVR